MHRFQSAIDELQQYRYLLSAKENCKNRIIELEERMVRIGSVDTQRLSVHNSSYDYDRMPALLDEKDEQIWRLASLSMKLSRFERAMEALSDEDRKVLSIFFLERADSPEDAAWALGIEKSCLYKKRNRALAHFTKALFGISEEND